MVQRAVYSYQETEKRPTSMRHVGCNTVMEPYFSRTLWHFDFYYEKFYILSIFKTTTSGQQQ